MKFYKCERCGYSPSGKQRSNQQSRYYWGIVVQILSEHTGFTKDEVHELLKRKFLKDIRMKTPLLPHSFKPFAPTEVYAARRTALAALNTVATAPSQLNFRRTAVLTPLVYIPLQLR